MRLLTNEDIAPLLDPAAVVATLEAAYRGYAEGVGVSLPRIDLQAQAGEGALYQLGLCIGHTGSRYAAIRLKSDMRVRRMVEGRLRKDKYCVEPGRFMGLILLFDIASGALLALMHDGLIQRLRVGCDSALGVRLLARADAEVLGVLGAGGMAEAHIDAIRQVRPLREVRIYSPTAANREALAERVRRSGLDALAVDAPEAVFRGADLVAACTSAIGPVVSGALLEPGMHVTCIGGTLDDAASARLDVALRFGEATVPLETGVRANALSFTAGEAKADHASASEYARPRPDARLSLAELIADPSRGRTRADQITFSERGPLQGIEFAALGGQVFEQAVAADAGRIIPDDLLLETIRN